MQNYILQLVNLLRNFVKANLGLNYRKAAAAKEILSNSLENKYLKQYPIFYYELAEALIASDETKALKYYIDFFHAPVNPGSGEKNFG